MTLLSNDFLFTSALLMTLLLHASCLDMSPLSAAPQAMLLEDKIRLGSTPPSCHNRCNACKPCWAVQVPTLPIGSSRAAQPGSKKSLHLQLVDQPAYSQYSNYKPLGWKCRCGDRLYNP